MSEPSTNVSVPNPLEMSLDQYIIESRNYTSPILNQRRIDDSNFFKGRRLEAGDDDDDDEDTDNDIVMANDENGVPVNQQPNVTNPDIEQKKALTANKGQQWRLFNGEARQLAAASVCSNDNELNVYNLISRPTNNNRYHKNVAIKNRRNFGFGRYNRYHHNNNNNFNGRKNYGIMNRTGRRPSKIDKRLVIRASSDPNSTVFIPVTGNKNNLVVSKPNEYRPQQENRFLTKSTPASTSTSTSTELVRPVRPGNMAGPIVAALDSKDVINAAMMPLVASQLLEKIRELSVATAAAVHQPKYDMKTQKEIHEVQHKALKYNCPKGEIISSDGRGLPATTHYGGNIMSLNCPKSQKLFASNRF